MDAGKYCLSGDCDGNLIGTRTVHRQLHDHMGWYRAWHHRPLRSLIHGFLLTALIVIVGATIVSYAPSVLNPQAAAGILEQLPFQARLTNPDGTVVADGSYGVVFKIYTVASGGSAVWTESHTGGSQVTTVDGVFSTMLGSITSLSGIDFNQDTYYIGITVGADPEMTPRIRLGSAPYAFNSDELDGLDSTDFFAATGLAGGQTAYGGTAASENLVLRSTSHGTKGSILLGDDGSNIGIGSSFTPATELEIRKSEAGNVQLQVYNPSTNASAKAVIDVRNDTAQGSLVVYSSTFGSGLANRVALVAEDGSEGLDLAVLDADGDLRVQTGGSTTQLIVTNEGDVGIGTTDPSAKLTIHNSPTSSGLPGLDEVMTDNTKSTFIAQAAYVEDTYIPGMAFSNSTSSYTKPIAAIWAFQNIAQGGSQIRMGTSNDFSEGVTNFGFVMNSQGHIALGGTTAAPGVLNIWNAAFQSNNIMDVTQTLNNAGIVILGDSENSSTYKSGIFWQLDHDDLDSFDGGKPVAGAWLYQNASDEISLLFGASDDGEGGINSPTMILTHTGGLEIGSTTNVPDPDASMLKVRTQNEDNVEFSFNENDDFFFGSSSITFGGDADTPDFVTIRNNTGEGTVFDGSGDEGILSIMANGDQNVGIRTTSPDSLYALDVNGDIQAASVSETSDARLKRNINYASVHGLGVITKLRPATYDFLDGSAGHSGFIAQDVQVVIPSIVRKGSDGYLGLNYSELIPYTVKAIQELNSEVEQLKVSDETRSLVQELLAGEIQIGSLTVNGVTSLKGNLLVEGDLRINGSILGSSKTRGINIGVAAGETSLVITQLDLPDANYAVTVTPSWHTSVWVTEKLADGFRIHFSEPAPAGATIDYLIQR